jgi:hypothetical protein
VAAPARSEPAPAIEPLILLGTLRARRGDPDHDAPLKEGLALALRTGEPQLIYPAHRALAESAWLAGDSDRAALQATAAREALQHSLRHPDRAEADYWCWRAGVEIKDDFEDAGASAHPYRLQIAGQIEPAATRWRDLGFPTKRPKPWPTARIRTTCAAPGCCSTGSASPPARSRSSTGWASAGPEPAAPAAVREPGQPGRADRPAAGDRRADRRAPDQPGDRPAALPADRRPPRLGDPGQARGGHPSARRPAVSRAGHRGRLKQPH